MQRRSAAVSEFHSALLALLCECSDAGRQATQPRSRKTRPNWWYPCNSSVFLGRAPGQSGRPCRVDNFRSSSCIPRRRQLGDGCRDMHCDSSVDGGDHSSCCAHARCVVRHRCTSESDDAGKELCMNLLYATPPSCWLTAGIRCSSSRCQDGLYGRGTALGPPC